MIEPTSTTPGNAHVTVREFESWQKSQAEIAALRQQLVEEARSGLERLTDTRFEALRLLIDERRATDQLALMLAGKEYERRLDALNGEQARLAADRERFVNREAYEQAQKDFTSWRDTVNAALSLGTGRERGISGTWGVMVVVVGIVITIITVILANWRV